MASPRQAPARLLGRPLLKGPDRLDRELGRVVEAARTAARSLEGEADLRAAFAALADRARGEGLEAVLGLALGLALVACDRLVGRAFPVAGEELRWELRPRDNQVACAAALARGQVAELDTGEGKTLAVALAAACLALGSRVHVVTANDYLARRDREWMGPLLEALGLEVGLVEHEVQARERKGAYRARVVYVSVKEVGADYLRDTLTSEPGALLLPALESAILDEVDFILVDEARVPLILAESGPASENLCHQFNEAVARLVAEQRERVARLHEELDAIEAEPSWSERKRAFERSARLATLLLGDPLDPALARRFAEAVEAGDGSIVRRTKELIGRYDRLKRRDELLEDLLYSVDRRAGAVQLTERGIDWLAGAFGDLFADPGDDPDGQLAHRARVRAVVNLIAAHAIHRRDRDYIVEDGRVVLVDQATGRPSFDRHLQHGLHRAIEAKEGLYPALDHQTAAEITFPGLFLLYERWSGTSGTCLELAPLFKKAYRKAVVRVPPHRPVVRIDLEDALFSTFDEKLEALVSEVRAAHALLQPVLVGTDSVEVSEAVSAALGRAGVDHEVLNARHHAEEARIIARAGAAGAVTVATAMAGRGTDIRPEEGLEETIARAVAARAASEAAEGRGVRLEVRTESEVARLVGALRAAGLEPKAGRRGGATLLDVGAPPSTATPCCLGLRVIGFDRFAEGRLDRQLRGRTGRQGAPGMTRFYVALDDETVLVHGDRARLAELGRKAPRRIDPLSGAPVRAHGPLLAEAQRAYGALAALVERGRERLRALDEVDQAQREHYDAERRTLLSSPDDEVSKLADEAIGRAARELVEEVLGEPGLMTAEAAERLDDMTQILFERRGMLASGESGVLPPPDLAAEALGASLRAAYGVARRWYGREAMARVERTVLLDALTEVWRVLAGERPELREQAELYAYAGKRPEAVYRSMAGKAYHRALRAAARTAAAVLVTFPLPREIKTPRTGLPFSSPEVAALLGEETTDRPSDSPPLDAPQEARR